MANAIIVSRQIVFATSPKEPPTALVTVPVGIYVDQVTAEKAAVEAGQLHTLADGVIMLRGKPTLTVKQLFAQLGIYGLSIITSGGRVRESLIHMP